MSSWRSGTFWASAVFGWFATMFVLAVLISIFRSEDMSVGAGIVVNVAHQLLSLVAGYAYGRRRFEMRQKKAAVGCPVVTKGCNRSEV